MRGYLPMEASKVVPVAIALPHATSPLVGRLDGERAEGVGCKYKAVALLRGRQLASDWLGASLGPHEDKAGGA